MPKGKRKAASAQPAVKRPVRMTSKDATHMLDKNSKTMTKIMELVALSQTEAGKALDQQRLLDRKIELLKIRLNKRLVKLSKWVDAPESDRLPLPVFRNVPSIYLPKGNRTLFATRGLPAHVLLENAFLLQQAQQSQMGAAAADSNQAVRPVIATTLQSRVTQCVESVQVDSTEVRAHPVEVGGTGSESSEPLKESVNLMGLLPPAKVTILPGRKIDKDTGERVTSEEQEMCECGTAYTYHNKSRHLKSIKHIEYITQKEVLLQMAAAQSTE